VSENNCLASTRASAGFEHLPEKSAVSEYPPNLQDALDCGFRRLDAMLALTVGEGGESFRIYNDEIQEVYLHGCALLATEVHQLYKQLESRAKFAD
jgi:hypothetical protein